MRLLEKTLATPAENLALDEALLDDAEDGRGGEVLRMWESRQWAVVLGRSSRLDDEVHRDACRNLGIPILRRASGGATVMIGPGCLMYALVLDGEARPHLRLIDQAHELVLDALAGALRPHVTGISRRGISDLVMETGPDETAARKISGNSLRCKRRYLLYHGTFLYDFRLDQIGACLRAPAREPAYRGGRAHGQFVANLPIRGADLRAAILDAWPVSGALEAWPQSRTEKLARQRYEQALWIEHGRTPAMEP